MAKAILLLLGIIALSNPWLSAQTSRSPAALSDLPLAGFALDQQEGITPGLWTGTMSIRNVAGSAASAQGQGSSALNGFQGSSAGSGVQTGPGSAFSASMSLKILEMDRGALLDIPDQSMFGYPLDDISWSAKRIRFVLDAFGPGQDMVFSGSFSSQGQNQTIVGIVQSPAWRGTFILKKTTAEAAPTETALEVFCGDVSLPGVLARPHGGNTYIPLVVLVAGSGPTDRDGNNYNVPGKTNVLKLLAEGLADRGIASFRYDKRGSGQAYRYESHEQQVSFTRHASDLVAILEKLQKEVGVSRLVVAAMNEGAWISALAINKASRQGILVDGFAVLDASGKKPLDILRDNLSELDETLRQEAEGIVQALLEGSSYKEPSETLRDFFSPQKREWLESWLSMDPAREIAAIKAPLILVRGEMDEQVPEDEFQLLMTLRPNAVARVIPGMNYMLKKVSTVEENYDSFTNPNYPIPTELFELLEALAKAKPLPKSSQVYQKKVSQ